MPSYPEGTAELTCRALLEHPRPDAHSNIALVFDAILRGSAIAEDEPLMCCSFCYVIKNVDERVDPSIYDITIKVSSFVLSLSVYSC